MSKIIDAVVWLDGLHLDDNESMDDLCEFIKANYRLGHDIMYVVEYEETVDD